MSTDQSSIDSLPVSSTAVEQNSCSNMPERTSVKRGWLSWGGKGVLALTDQGLIGGSNFLIAILLARQLPRAQYGAYAVAFEIFMVLSLAYACLILEPMLVFGPSRYRENIRQYFGVLLWMHLGIAFATALLLGGSAWVIHELGKSPNLPPVLTAAMFATPCVLLFWLARRAFYVKLDPRTAVLGGLIYGSVLLGGVLLLYRLRSLSPAFAFVLMAAGALAASPFLLARLKPCMSLKRASLTLREAATKHWVYGRWALAAAVASWMAGNIYFILLSTMRGLADTGSLKALLNLASPVGQIFAAVSVLVLPYAARMARHDGAIGVKRLSSRLIPLYAIGGAAYWIVLLLFMHPIVHFLYGGNYLQVQYLVPWVAVGSVLRTTTVVQMVSLRALQLPFLVFVAFALSDAAAVLIGIPAVRVFGLQGAVGAYVLSGAVGFLAGLILLRNVARRIPHQLPITSSEITPSAAL